MIRGFILILLLGLHLGRVEADATPLQRLQNFLQRAGTLQAEFTQTRIAEKDQQTGQKATGRFYLQRPGRFRWDYLQPYRQQIVSSGGKVWFYDVDLEQVTARRLNQAVGSTPALLLSGEIELARNFNVEQQGESEGLYWIRLVPRSEESGFRYVTIGLDGDRLAGMELSDQFGQLTRIYFSQVVIGQRLPPDLFEFKPPKGVDLFEER
ncbi:outer membrane lipoprotein chaperone LolA [Candidatus Woesearchaeota archaeon]|nr:outer membrane lipoprotein chaperone LolA [Candidatus Woesearchaeota archaeon]